MGRGFFFGSRLEGFLLQTNRRQLESAYRAWSDPWAPGSSLGQLHKSPVTRLTLPDDNPCASIGTLRRADQGFVLFSFAPHSGTQVGPRSASYQQFARRWPAPVLFSGGPPPGDPVGHISVEDCK